MSVHEVLNKLKGVKRSGSGWTAKCPAHEDQHNSLSINEGDNGKELYFCHAGCSFEQIVATLGIERQSSKQVVAEYDYRDESRTLLYQAVRFSPKGFSQRRPNGRGGYEWKLNGTRRVIYHLPELLTSLPGSMVFIAEGEKDCDRLAGCGLIATTNVGGAGKWRDEYSECLRGRAVVILPDNDEPGHKHAAQVARSLQGIAASIRIIELPDLAPKGDVSDWLNAGNTIEDLLKLVESAPQWKPETGSRIDEGLLHVVRMADVEAEEVSWLWHPYIPLGKLTLLEGDPGLGKSWLTCALAAGVSCGRGLPGAGIYEPGNVLMLSAEDGLGDTLRPRLDAVGADVSRVLALAEPVTFDAAGLIQLEATIIEYKPVLVIINPLFAFTGGKVDIHRANECRAISAPLAAVAERQGCAMVAVRHLGKARGGGHPLNAGIGSIDFAAAARSVLLVGADPDETNKRAIVQIKNNLAPHGPAIGYTLEDSCFYWTGESDLTAGRILAPASDDEERSTIADAVDYLRTALATGARDSKAIKDEARHGGISEKTLLRAKIRLNVQAKKIGAPGSHYQKWVWELPSSEDGQVREVDHLRASETDKDTYGNNLAEDGQPTVFDHLRGPVDHLRLVEVVTDVVIPAGMSDEEYEQQYRETRPIITDYVTDEEGNRYNI